jgi:DNA polymerase/3'-5' exonuclease PolX
MVSYNYALGIAQEFCEEIKDFCDIPPEIVGSIRRKKPQVNDIDILVIPRFEETPDDTLFGNITQINTLDSKLVLMCFENQMKLETNGEKIKRFSNYSDSGLTIDLYIAIKETLPTLRLIRTGSKEHNIKLCMRARDLRMQLKADGTGLFDAQLKQMKVENEEDIFRLLNLEYLSPEKRE